MVPDAFVVIIPGVGDPSVEQWNRDIVYNETLVDDLVKHSMSIQIIILEDRLRFNGRVFLSWRQIREISHTMMQLLQEYREETDTMTIPMVFIGHGIGGIIAKDFFWKSSLADCRDYPNRWHENLVNTTAGIILLGTPHFTNASHFYHENTLALVTKPKTSGISKTPPKELMDLNWRTEYVRVLSEEFDKYIRQYFPNLPILSVAEGRESKAMRVKENRLTLRRWEVENYVIVEKDLTKIGLPNEEMVVADCDHYQLCTHNDAEFRQRLIGFCHEKLLEAHGRVLGRPGRSSMALSTGSEKASILPSP